MHTHTHCFNFRGLDVQFKSAEIPQDVNQQITAILHKASPHFFRLSLSQHLILHLINASCQLS